MTKNNNSLMDKMIRNIVLDEIQNMISVLKKNAAQDGLIMKALVSEGKPVIRRRKRAHKRSANILRVRAIKPTDKRLKANREA